MSPRRKPPRKQAAPDEPSGVPFGGTLRRVEEYDGEDWVVQTIPGTSGRFYRCPGCDQEIPPGVGHVVAWPAYGAGVDDRRHWHRACWGARERRTTNVQRGRNAPRH